MTYSLTKYIITLVVVYGIIYTVIFRDKTKEYLNNNWKTIRCYPHIIPIAGLSDAVDGNGFVDKTVNNFNACSASMIKSSLDIFMKPIMSLLEGLKRGLNSITNVINVLRRMSKVLREMFATLVQNTAKRMANSYSAIIYFQEKLKLLIKKQSAMFEVLMQFTKTLPLLMYSFSRGPIPRFGLWLAKYVGAMIAVIVICLACIFGGPFTKIVACPICAVCFPGDTPVDMPDNTKVLIRDLQIGDKIKNNTVLGKIYIKPHRADTYFYKGTTVSGSHLVFEDNHWIRVENSKKAEFTPLVTELYCLITSDNTISINGTKFRDYEEIKDKDIKLAVNYKFAKYINNNIGYIKTPKDIDNCYYWGFSKDNKIVLEDKDVALENIIKNPEKYDDVYGIVEIKSDADMYDYKGCIVSGNTLVYETGLWIRVFQSDYATKTDNVDTIYSIVTEDNMVTIKGNDAENIIFRDFIESHDDEINDDADKLVESRLNLIFDFEN